MKGAIEVCLSPDLIGRYELQGKVAVVVDILRATSCMVAGLGSGIQGIKPFSDLERCRAMKEEGYFIAGERNGEKVPGFDLGNSPFEYMQPHLKGEKVATTTTNGTLAIEKSSSAKEIIIGAFLNFSAIVNYLKQDKKDVIIVCAGWKGKVNLEDTLFAGALVAVLEETHTPDCDAPIVARSVFEKAGNDFEGFLSGSSHVKRLNRLEIKKDITYCLKKDQFGVIPKVNQEGFIVI